MAGRPQQRAILAELTRRGRVLFELDPGDAEPATIGLDFVCAWLEDGGTIVSLANDLSAPGQKEDRAHRLGFRVTRERLQSGLQSAYGAETVTVQLAQSRARSSYAHAEIGLQTVEEQALTPVDVQRNSARARQRNWMAERFNGALAGPRGANVTINIQALHLAALQAPEPGALAPALGELVPRKSLKADAQVVDAEGVTVEAVA